MIIGNDLLDQAEILINKNNIKITKTKPEVLMMFIDTIKEDERDIGLTINEEYKKGVQELVSNYKPIKKKNTNVTMSIALKQEQPVFCRPRRMASAEKKVVDDLVEWYLKERTIESRTSEYTSQVVIAKEKIWKTENLYWLLQNQ